LHFKGVSTDLGPHRLHTEIPEVEALVSEICAPSIYTVRRRSRIFLRGKYITYPPSPIETALHLGPLQCAAFALGMAREKFRSPPQNESYESLMRGAFGSSLYEFMLRPYSAKVWKTDPTQIHPDTARVRVSAGSLAKLVKGLFTKEKKGSETALKEFRYVKGGVATLVRHLTERAEAAGAEMRVSHPVSHIDLEPTGEAGRYRAVAVRAGADPIEAGAIVSTVPLPVLLGELLPKVEPLAEAREAAAGLTYLNMIFVLIIVKRKIISGDNWLYFPEPEWIFNRAYEAKNFDPEMGPDDRSVLCVEITCRAGDEIERTSDEELAEKTSRSPGRDFSPPMKSTNPLSTACPTDIRFIPSITTGDWPRSSRGCARSKI
jgi:protoporphyrinogen oxidase